MGVINLQIKQEFQANFNEKILQAWVRGTLNYLEVEDCDLSIVIGNNSEIHQLNREYRHIDAPTDVLSFVYDMIDPETETRYLGDIIISAEKFLSKPNKPATARNLKLARWSYMGSCIFWVTIMWRYPMKRLCSRSKRRS